MTVILVLEKCFIIIIFVKYINNFRNTKVDIFFFFLVKLNVDIYRVLGKKKFQKKKMLKKKLRKKMYMILDELQLGTNKFISQNGKNLKNQKKKKIINHKSVQNVEIPKKRFLIILWRYVLMNLLMLSINYQYRIKLILHILIMNILVQKQKMCTIIMS